MTTSGRVPIDDPPGRLEAVEAIHALRRAVITENPLDAMVQLLVHFGQLVVLGHAELATCRATAARQAGATPTELIGVVETALFVSGMPAYSLGISVLSNLFAEDAFSEGGIAAVRPFANRTRSQP